MRRTADAPPARHIDPAPPGSGGWIRRLMVPFLAAHKTNVAIAFGMAIVGMVISAITPLIEKVIVDDVIVAHNRAMAPLLAVLIGAGGVTFAASFVRRFVGGRVALDVQYDMRNAIYERLQRLDFATHDELQTGQLVSRASSDVGLLQGLLSFLPLMLGNLIMTIVAFVVMFFLSPPLTLVALAAVPALFVLSIRLRKTMYPASWDAQQKVGEVAGVVDEAVSGVRVVKGFGQEERELRRLVDVGDRLYKSKVRVIKLTARYSPALQSIPVLAQVGMLAFGGWLAIEGHLTIGTFLAFASYMVQLTSPVRQFSMLLAIGQQARAGGERILDLLDANPLVVEQPDAAVLPKVHGEIEIDDVQFGYTSDEPVLDGFTLRVRAGETVALVGASGSGKSTIALLLPRFYDVKHGAVRVDGVDVRDVTLDSLRSQIGVVFEDSFLFSDSVRNNIAFGRPNATDEEVVAAARAAEADRFIAALPDGYDTVVGELGLTLSGGQRQRVALARALITDPRILLLDDATSAVDSRTEEEIHATLRKIMQGRTTILIAHRRSTLRLADRIVVLERGRVSAEGTHEELLERSPLYRLLLSGPGEGIENEDDAVVAGIDGVPGAVVAGAVVGGNGGAEVGGVTVAAWQPPGDQRDPALAVSAAAAGGRMGLGGGLGGGGGGGGAWGGMPPLAATPE